MDGPYGTLYNDEGISEGSSSTIRRYGEIEEHIDAIETAFHQFRNFEVLENPPSDHFFMASKKLNRPNIVLIEKTIKQEWEMLRRYHSDSIYIRAYEQRPDLMRAIIIGPEATPYRKGLFCFDIQFPTDYPNQPPRIFYRSNFFCPIPNFSTSNGTLNLEPLHNGGNSGKSSFFNFKNIFSPPKSKSTTTTLTSSSVLQTLTTIQSFFSAHETTVPSGKLVDHEKRVIMQTANAMRVMLRSPPKDFKVFVYGYFRTQAHQILMNYKFHLDLDETITKVGFFLLIRAFEDNGTYCQHHYNKEAYDRGLLELPETHDQKQSENSTTTKRKPTSSHNMY